MTLTEKLTYLQDNYFSKWLEMRQEVDDEMSNRQLMFCVCGRLATGLHEMYCKKFKDHVIKETVKRLEYLINDKGRK